ncbi:hypothetical protein [Nocardioides zeicaulis]|uniref:Uncharacterized protein n=1 Tax=Nocardioides zeicaulis TaxID=1776857 RepID=A0ABV6E1H1_9ACTN
MSVTDPSRAPGRHRRADGRTRGDSLDGACSRLDRAFQRITPTIDGARKPVRAWHRLMKDVRGDNPRPKRGTPLQRFTSIYTSLLLGYGALQPDAELTALHNAITGAPGGRALLAINVVLLAMSGAGLIRKRPPG